MKRTESGFTTHNKLARLVTKRVSRPRGPSNGTICKWEKEWKDTGLSFKIPFSTYLKRKEGQWWKEKKLAKRKKKNV